MGGMTDMGAGDVDRNGNCCSSKMTYREVITRHESGL
jgi:hypothetical protein